MTFASDKYYAEFGGVKLYIEDYEISRSAAAGETLLSNRAVSLYFGGARTVKIRLTGTSESPCADILDGLMRGGSETDLTYAGMVFRGVILTKYECSGKSGESEKVVVEFSGEAAVAEEVIV